MGRRSNARKGAPESIKEGKTSVINVFSHKRLTVEDRYSKRRKKKKRRKERDTGEQPSESEGLKQDGMVPP